jgi:hypothetical protein
MALRANRILFLLFSILGSQLGFSQSNEITIEFIGNCGLHLTDGEANLYVDFPYKSGAHNYMEFDQAELDSVKENAFFLFTHKHADHYSKKNLRKVLKEKSGKTFGPWNISDLENLAQLIPEFEIRAFRTEHKVFGISFKHYSYLINWHGKKVYLSGDTENAETIGSVSAIDLAFIPVWLLIDSNEKKIKLDAQKLAIYHIGPNDNINITGEKVLMLDQQGQVITIPY